MLPPGYQVHPSDGRYMFNDAGDVQLIPQDVAAPPAAPALPAAALPAAAAAAPAAASGPAYGQQDLAQMQTDQEAADRAAKQRKTGSASDLLYLDWPELTKVGQSVELILRFMPPWAVTEPSSYLEVAQHRIFAQLCPDAKEGRQVMYYTCHNTKYGPGNCPICRDLSGLPVGSEEADNFRRQAEARIKVAWQALDLMDPQSHFQQRVDASGVPIEGEWDVLPKIFRIAPSLQTDLTVISRTQRFMDPMQGAAISCVKKKTGKSSVNVEYSATLRPDLIGPIDESLMPVLLNLVDLRKACLYFDDAEVLETVAENIRATYGAVPASGASAGVPDMPTPAPAPVAGTLPVAASAAGAPSPAAAPAPAAAAPAPTPAVATPQQVLPGVPVAPPAPAVTAAPAAGPPAVAVALPPAAAPGLPAPGMPAAVAAEPAAPEAPTAAPAAPAGVPGTPEAAEAQMAAGAPPVPAAAPAVVPPTAPPAAAPVAGPVEDPTKPPF